MHLNKRDLVMVMYGAELIYFGKSRWKLHQQWPTVEAAPLKVNFRPGNYDFPRRGLMVSNLAEQAGRIIASVRCQAGYRPFPGYVAGVPDAGTGVARGFTAGWPERQRPKQLELSKNPSGEICCGDPLTYPEKGEVCLIDDVLSRADSKLQAIAALEKFGFKVTTVAVFIEHDLDGRESLEDKGINVFSVMTMVEALQILEETGLIPHTELEKYDRFCQSVRVASAAIA